MVSNFTCFTFQKRENIKIGHFTNIAFRVYILSLKPQGKGDCKNVIRFSSVLCLFIFFLILMKNLDCIYIFFELVELKLY